PPQQATTATPFVATVELLSSPFRPSPSLSPPATALPGCFVLGNTTRRRRRHLPAAGKPAPLLSFSSAARAGKRRKEGRDGRKKEKKKKKRY
ncbi:Os07g0620700, partial [Oryza sativa Japonica Group]